ncbi:methyltransferase domain-containing protein [Paenibacillus aurantius]|uniref:Methyltransferase domain-containing protein n=1 Tax=Paenibacillus aurantius TaxID=2918900 RepID=A0AA96LCT8_9BACL|nr:methyltransferase domain-containing protein [Paenibacillus aurantius]WNQ10804.1 methyltransferase domain-containing protein [Paenibacillus aurantius]
MKDTVTKFYDDFAEDYHLIHGDWDSAIDRQSMILNNLIRVNLSDSRNGQISLLDCSCGIGTQAIGLAKHGYVVTATDISPASIQRAIRESESRGIKIAFGVADFRTLISDVPGEFDVVLSADNAIPHLQSDDDLNLAGQNMYSKVRQDGLLVVSIRDYDGLLQEKPRATKPNVFDNGKRIAFQVWDWADDSKTYTVNLFVVQEFNGNWETKHFSTTYRALKRDELSSILRSCGFIDVRWHMPEESGFYQPIVTARKPPSPNGK